MEQNVCHFCLRYDKCVEDVETCHVKVLFEEGRGLRRPGSFFGPNFPSFSLSSNHTLMV